MRFRSIAKWVDPENCKASIYFAQILEEMLFDFSLDTYKASVMNTSLLCMEAIQTLKQFEAGNIKAPNIWHVTAELCKNLENDAVARALIPLPFSAFFPTLKNRKTPLKELQNVLELLAVQLAPFRYWAKNEELLVQEVVGRQSIPEVRRLARSYVTTLVYLGFSQKHLHEIVIKFFYSGKARIKDAEAITDFFALFSKELIDFTIVFRVEKIFEHVADAFLPVGLTITRELPADIDLSGFPSFLSNGEHRPLYAIVSKIAARDIYSASALAERLLKLCSTFLSLFHHKEDPSWDPECIVLETKNKKYKQVQKPINSMHKCSDLLQSVASKRLRLFMNDFSLEQDSFSKFMRSAQLHSMALGSNADENQILNLWISLESLIPSETKSDDVSNIEHIVASLVPFLNLEYIGRLLNNLVKDLLRWNPVVTKKAIRSIPGKKFIEKIAKLLALPQFGDERAILETALCNFPLLHDRFNYFQSVLANPAKVVDALDAHKIRLEWQIRRIYRTRNIIVHSGETPSYTQLLIEHAHDYLDAVLSSLVQLASKPEAIYSVGQGFKYAELKYTTYYKNLSEKGLLFDVDNIDSLLFVR